MSEPRQPKARRWWIAGSVIALLAAIGGGFALAVLTPASTSFTLADGSKASIVAVTSGAEEPVIGNPVQKLLYQVLPASLRHWSAVRVLRARGPGLLNVWVRSSSTQARFAATVIDDSGDDSEGCSQTDIEDVLLFAFNTYPRRKELTTLRLYAPERPSTGAVATYSSGWKKVGELPLSRLPQSGVGNWNAPSLPAIGRAGSLQVSVTQLAVGEAARFPDIPRAAGETFASVTLRITQNGRPARGWYPDLESISDATGNEWRAFAHKRFEQEDGSFRLHFTTPARRGEDVWKLRFVLRRDTSAPPLADEVWRVAGIPLPKPGQVIPLKHKTRLQGMLVELVGVYGRFTSVPAPGAPVPVTGGGGVLIRISRPANEIGCSVLSMRDQLGRDVDAKSSSGFGTQNDAQWLHTLAPAKSSRTFDLTYVVQRARYVELKAPRTLMKP